MNRWSQKAAWTAVAAVLLLSGCGDKKEGPGKPQFVEHCEYAPGVQAPEWYCNPQVEGGIAAVGEAKPNPGNDGNMQRNMAMSSARDALAQQIETRVKNMLDSWARTTGAGEAQTYESNFESVSRQVAQQTLRGSAQLKRWVAPDGTLILLVGITDQTQISENIRTSLNNDEALYQQFSAQRAQENLQAEIDREFGSRR
jgi:hypothetical protein